MKKICGIFNQPFNLTPLIIAARDGQTKIVEILLSQPGIDVNSKDVQICKFSFNLKQFFFNGIFKLKKKFVKF